MSAETQMLITSIGFAGMIGFMWWLTAQARKKLGVGRGTVTPESLRVVGKRVLEGRKALFVVEVADRYVLLGTSEDSISLLDHITADEFALMSETQDAKEPRDNDFIEMDFDTDNENLGRPVEPQRFATVGESFSMLLGKAKAKKQSKTGTKA